MFARVLLVLTLAFTALFVTNETVEARLFGNRPVRTFFQNRQPVRRIVRGAARVVVAPVRFVARRQPVRKLIRGTARVTARVVTAPVRAVANSAPLTATTESFPGEYPVLERIQNRSNVRQKSCRLQPDGSMICN
jgi:hypothetical protein